MTKLIEIIVTEDRRGRGVVGDPIYTVTQYFTKEGELLFEKHPDGFGPEAADSEPRRRHPMPEFRFRKMTDEEYANRHLEPNPLIDEINERLRALEQMKTPGGPGQQPLKISAKCGCSCTLWFTEGARFVHPQASGITHCDLHASAERYKEALEELWKWMEQDAWVFNPHRFCELAKKIVGEALKPSTEEKKQEDAHGRTETPRA